jgi:hypothetical protein
VTCDILRWPEVRQEIFLGLACGVSRVNQEMIGADLHVVLRPATVEIGEEFVFLGDLATELMDLLVRGHAVLEVRCDRVILLVISGHLPIS